MTLHILSRSDSLNRALPAIAADDELLLIGARQTLLSEALEKCPNTKLHILEESSEGFLPGQPNVASYSDFVALTIKHPHCLSW